MGVGIRVVIKGFAALVSVGIALIFVAVQVDAMSRGYNTDDDGVRSGMALTVTDDEGKVERASSSNGSRFIGVATDGDASSVTISSADKNVLVEVDGQVDALVSDLNGQVNSGDLLALSPLRGVLMRAEGSSGQPVALATKQADFSSGQTADLDSENGTKTVRITTVRVNLDPKAVAVSGASQEPASTLEKLGEKVVGKPVSEARVVLTIVLFLVILIVEGGIIYGAVSSSITSIGRNPMARKFIHSDLLRVAGVAIIVLSLGLGAMYLMLWV